MEAENKSRLNKLDLQKNSRPIRLGIVGGASGGFIGPVHAMAARMDNRYRIVAGALSSRPLPDGVSSPFLRLELVFVFISSSDKSFSGYNFTN